MKKLALLNLVFNILSVYPVFAQRITEIGLTGGVARFYPDAKFFGRSQNNFMDNGWGGSAGIFIEDHWKPKIHEIIELNYYQFNSDIFLEKLPDLPWSPYDGTGRVPIYRSYDQTGFGYIAVSGAIKYFLNQKLFVYPGFEFARSLNKEVYLNKTTYHLKLGAGADFKHMTILLEYTYGLRYQERGFDPLVPFITSHRNKFLQLKVQVPLYRIR